MSQTTFVLKEHAAEADRFEGIGPYMREQFRLAPGPQVTARGVAAPAPRTQTPLSRPVAPAETERMDRHTYVLEHWCDVGISLIVLISGAVALFRLICLGQP